MVPAALLRHSPLDYVPDLVYLEQAGRGDFGILVAFYIVLPAVARHLAGAQRALPANLQMGVLAAGDRRNRTWLGRREPARGDRRDRRADRCILLLLPYADPVPADRKTRAATAVAEQHRHRDAAASRRRRGAVGETL